MLAIVSISTSLIFYQFMDTLETDYNTYRYTLTAEEEIAAFPEALDILKRNRKLYKKRLKEFKEEIISKLKGHKLEEYQIEFVLEVHFLKNREIAEIIKNLNFVERNIYKLEKQSKLNHDFSLELQQAKSVPITSVIEKLGIQIKMNTISCPFHQERTPSCHLYPKTNTYKCFGCGAFGDSIDFVQKYLNADFKAAVNYINS